MKITFELTEESLFVLINTDFSKST